MVTSECPESLTKTDATCCSGHGLTVQIVLQPDMHAKHLSAFSLSPSSHWSVCTARSKHTTLVQGFLFSEKHIFHFPVQQTFRRIVAAARSLQITGSTALYSFANASLTTKPSRAGRHWRLTGCIHPHKAR